MDVFVPRGSTTNPLYFVMVLASDHRTPATGLTPTVVLSKAGGAFAAPAGAVSEVGSGVYVVAANSVDVNTIGPLMLRATDRTNTADLLDTFYSIIPALGVPPITQKTPGYPLPFLVISSTDHVSGLAGITPALTICPSGGSFATPAGTVTEVGGTGNGRGWYVLNPTSADLATAGPLLLHWTATGADAGDARFDVAPLTLPSSGKFGNGPTLHVLVNRINLYRLTVPNPDPDGAIQNQWTSLATNVKCSVQPIEQWREDPQGSLRLHFSYDVMFDYNPGITIGDYAQWTDDAGVTRTIIIVGTRNMAGRGSAFLATGDEVTLN